MTPERTLLRNVDLTLSPGELVGLIGPNGAGKSTLLRAIVGTVRASAGSVSLNGRDIETYDPVSRARALAYLPQERSIEWPLPSREIVMLGRYPHARRLGPPDPDAHNAVARALEAVDALDLADRRATVLSGGERTRVLLARALAVEAPLLVADEPIMGLDPYHQLHVMEILRDAARAGAGVLAVLHELTLTMRFMDRAILLNAGRVVAEGPPRDVLTAENLREVYRVTPARGGTAAEEVLVPWSRV